MTVMETIGNIIQADCLGGEFRIRVDVGADGLPLSCSADSEWISVKSVLGELSVIVGPNTGFGDRHGSVTVTDRGGSVYKYTVTQGWYEDVRIECPEEAVIPYTYYDTHEYYQVYVTVYGGETQGFKTRGLTKYTEKVWSASASYKDYVIRIPKGVSGVYTLTHSDLSSYEGYCSEHGIPFDRERVVKKMRIRQVSEEDMLGTMQVDTGHGVATEKSKVEIPVGFMDEIHMELLSCSHVSCGSDGLYVEVADKTVICSCLKDWVSCRCEGSDAYASVVRPNPFAKERRADIKVSSPSNPKLFAIVTLVQKPSSVKG